MSLIKRIYPSCKIVSIVGMAKNAGKTVTLNRVIEEAIEECINIGLTSTGRDGEKQDIVTKTEKPTIYVEEGTLIATAAETLSMGDAKIEIISVTDYTTPLGNIVIGKVRDSGYVQIAGPQTNKGIKAVCDIMLSLGAQLVLIDGAINRVASASPSVSEGAVLATGAVISRNMSRVIEETVHTVELFGLSEVDDNVSSIVDEIISNGKIAIIDNQYSVEYLDLKTALNSGTTIAGNIKEDTAYVVFPGSLVKKTLTDIQNTNTLYKNVTFVVNDGTKIFIDPKSWIYFKNKGFSIKVLDSIKTLVVTVNPYSPEGYYFEQEGFLSKMKNYLKGIPVLDVCGGDLYE
jgi:hypothetical protein